MSGSVIGPLADEEKKEYACLACVQDFRNPPGIALDSIVALNKVLRWNKDKRKINYLNVRKRIKFLHSNNQFKKSYTSKHLKSLINACGTRFRNLAGFKTGIYIFRYVTGFAPIIDELVTANELSSIFTEWTPPKSFRSRVYNLLQEAIIMKIKIKCSKLPKFLFILAVY